MLKRITEFFVVDILISLDKIKRYSQDFQTLEEFLMDEKTCDAIMRELELIGEAVRHVLICSQHSNLVNQNWRIIVDFRNVIAHEYFGINYHEIFNIINNDILHFEQEFLEFIQQIPNSQFYIALEFAKKELAVLNRTHSIKHLEYIELLLKQKKST